MGLIFVHVLVRLFQTNDSVADRTERILEANHAQWICMINLEILAPPYRHSEHAALLVIRNMSRSSTLLSPSFVKHF